MKIRTRKFGEIEIDENKILDMPDGLPGFADFEKFVLLEDPKTAPFCWFQSTQEANLSLIVMNPFLFEPGYQLDLEDLIASRDWKDVSARDLLIYVVVNVSEGKEGTRITANLMGPLVINPNNNEAVQMVIPDTVYSHQHDVLAAS